MYSSILKTKTRPGDWIVLPGAGGGLGHMYVDASCLCLDSPLMSHQGCPDCRQEGTESNCN